MFSRPPSSSACSLALPLSLPPRTAIQRSQAGSIDLFHDTTTRRQNLFSQAADRQTHTNPPHPDGGRRYRHWQIPPPGYCSAVFREGLAPQAGEDEGGVGVREPRRRRRRRRRRREREPRRHPGGQPGQVRDGDLPPCPGGGGRDDGGGGGLLLVLAGGPDAPLGRAAAARAQPHGRCRPGRHVGRPPGPVRRRDGGGGAPLRDAGGPARGVDGLRQDVRRRERERERHGRSHGGRGGFGGRAGGGGWRWGWRWRWRWRWRWGWGSRWLRSHLPRAARRQAAAAAAAADLGQGPHRAASGAGGGMGRNRRRAGLRPGGLSRSLPGIASGPLLLHGPPHPGLAPAAPGPGPAPAAAAGAGFRPAVRCPPPGLRGNGAAAPVPALLLRRLPGCPPAGPRRCPPVPPQEGSQAEQGGGTRGAPARAGAPAPAAGP